MVMEPTPLALLEGVMGVYEDMANDAGYRYGTPENRQLAAYLEEEEWRNYQAQKSYAEAEYDAYCEWVLVMEELAYEEEIYYDWILSQKD